MKAQINNHEINIEVDTEEWDKMIQCLMESDSILLEYLVMNDAIEEGDVDATEWELDFYKHCKNKQSEIEELLIGIGVYNSKKSEPKQQTEKR